MKFKIKTNLVSGIVMGLFSAISLIILPYQVHKPGYDSGVPSPRILPALFLGIILAFSIVLIIQSLVFKKEKIVEFDWSKEKPALLLIALLCIYVVLINTIGYMLASAICFTVALAYCGEKIVAKWLPIKEIILIALAAIYCLTMYYTCGLYAAVICYAAALATKLIKNKAVKISVTAVILAAACVALYFVYGPVFLLYTAVPAVVLYGVDRLLTKVPAFSFAANKVYFVTFIYIFTILCGIGIYYLFINVFHVSLPSGSVWKLIQR